MKKQILSVLITLVMLISLVTVMSVSTSAADEHTHCVCGATHEAVGNHTEEEIINWVAWDGVSEISYDSNKTAYVYLAADVVLSERVFVQDNYKLYICLNGHNISAAEEYEVSAYGAAFRLEGYADLTITDCKNTVNEGYVDAETGLWTPGTAEEEGDVTYNLSGGVIYGFNAIGCYGTIYIPQGDLNLYGINIAGNKTSQGQIYLNSALATANIYDCTFVGNAATSGGGAFYAYKADYVNFISDRFEYNTAQDGGAICIVAGETISVTDCLINKNTATNTIGGGAYFSSKVKSLAVARCTVTNNKIMDNYDASGGGIYIGAEQATVSDTVISGNEVLEVLGTSNYIFGSAVYVIKNVTMTNCEIKNNFVPKNGIGTVYVHTAATLTMENCTVSGNTASSGSGVYTGGTVTLNGCTFIISSSS